MDKLRISENKRYFVKADGTPFTWIADTVWTMPQRIKWDDAEYFIQKRKSQGFTVLQIVALDPEQDDQMRNPVGIKALQDDDLTKPEERYFEYLDWILDKAEEYGFYVLLLPVWGQLVVGDDWMGGIYAKTVTEENAFWYGQWIGNRYKNRNNIIWCLGGDRQPIHKGVDYRNVWRRMAEGLASGVLNKELKYNENEEEWKDLLITYHACHEMETGECSTMSYWTEEENWIQFIMLQSGHGLKPKNYELVEKEYNRASRYGHKKTMPVWDGEPAYEEMPTSFPDFTERHGSWMVRKRAYWALFAGAFGHTYGHCNVWPSVSEKQKNSMMSGTWCEALDSEGSGHIKILRDFMESVPLMECVPAQEMICQDEEGVMDAHVQAAIHKDKKFLCAYLPSGGSYTLKVGELLREDAASEDSRMESSKGNSVYGWWFNPRDGKCYDEKMQETGTAFVCETVHVNGNTAGEMTVTAPEQGAEKDWILLLYTKETAVPVVSGAYGKEQKEEEVKKVFEW